MMAAMIIVMVVFMVVGGHHGFGSHDREANRPSAEAAQHMQHGEAAPREDEKQ